MIQAPGHIRSAERARLGEVDRYLVPLEEQRALDYFLASLFAAHGSRERLMWQALSSPFRPLARHLLFSRTWSVDHGVLRPEGQEERAEVMEPWRDAARLLPELREAPDVLDAAGVRPLLLGRTIVMRDYEAPARGRVILFPFGDEGLEPAAAVKLRNPSAPGTPLASEVEALRRVRARSELADSVPDILSFRQTERAEILVLSILPGRSAYVTMQTSLRPWRLLADHFRVAAEWLATFHNSFDDGEASQESSVHGDYWPRNLLLRPLPGGDMGAAVVDWENFRSGLPLEDVFQFPLSYGLNYPWNRYHRLPTLEAFRRTFIESTHVAEHVARYFERYCTLTGLDPAELRPALLAHLRARAESDPDEGGVWLACAAVLESAVGEAFGR